MHNELELVARSLNAAFLRQQGIECPAFVPLGTLQGFAAANAAVFNHMPRHRVFNNLGKCKLDSNCRSFWETQPAEMSLLYGSFKKAFRTKPGAACLLIRFAL